MISICGGSKLSHSLFCAYMKGGRKWPQLRGGINVFLIKEILNSQNLSLEVKNFANTEFNENQIEKIKFVMNQDHQRAGVVLKKKASDALVINEWKKAKASALYSLYYSIRGTLLVPEKLSEVNYDSTAYQEEVIGYFNKDRDYEQLIKIASIAQDTIMQHHDLSLLFTLTNFNNIERKNEYLMHQHRYDSTMINYGISESIIEDAESIKISCGKVITDLLQQNLNSFESKKSTQWIRWGFTIKKKAHHDNTY